jgi:LemA protein
MSLAGWIILGVIVVIALFLVVIYNRLVSLRQTVNQSWSDITVQLKQRHDLVPNLVETVKGYAAHERQTLEAVTAARTNAVQAQQAGPAQQAQAENVLSGALRQLFALSENYPDLKANQNFLSLQEELTSTEDRIAYARQFYNDSVQKYNTKIQTFPTVIVAGMFNFSKREFFEAEEGSTEVPKVQF